MALQDLVNKVELSTKKEIERLEKESSLKLKELDKSFQKELDTLKTEKEKELKQEKEKELERIKKEKEHNFEMKVLSFKNELLDKAIKETEKEFENLETDQKKEVLKKEFEKIKPFLNEEDTVIYIPQDKKEMISLLKEIGVSNIEILEKDLSFNDGFLVESENFFVEVSFKKIIKEVLQENKGSLIKTLFSK